MTSRFHSSFALGTAFTAATLGFAACELDLSSSDVAVADASTQLSLRANCPPAWGCTGNSPIVGHMGLHELSLDQIPDPSNGLYLVEFRKGAKSYKLERSGTALLARDAKKPALTLEHEALEGGKIVLRSTDPALVDDVFELGIVDVNPSGASYWRGPAESVETYRITYHIASISSPRNRRGPFELCPNPNPSSDPDAGKMGLYDVVFFGGDRYIAESKTVLDQAADQGKWVNIGCAGSVLAKLLLQRHSPAAFSATIAPDWERRQTLMNLYSANYCGTGRAFTNAGEPLAFVTREEGSAAFTGPIANYESLWGPEGASCLDVARLTQTQRPWTAGVLLADIKKECGGKLPEPCSSLPGWGAPLKPFGEALMLSANPSGS